MQYEGLQINVATWGSLIGTWVFLHFTHIEMRLPQPGLHPVPSGLAAQRQTAQLGSHTCQQPSAVSVTIGTHEAAPPAALNCALLAFAALKCL